MTPTILPKPEYGRLYGITHDPESRLPLARVKRVLKVGIGIPKGRAIQVFLHDDKWHIRHGAWEAQQGSNKQRLVMKTVFVGGKDGTPNTKEAAKAFHEKWKSKAAVSNRPQKQPWFGFTERSVTEDPDTGKPVETFEPDFDAIEAHGNRPRRIRVVITSDNPLRQADEWWTASELKCRGDGLIAERVLSAGSEKDEYWKMAKAAGMKVFPYTKCRLGGCEHAGVDCKQHSTLEIQLAYSLRLGATAYFTSTGGVTASQLHSSLIAIREPLERMGYGIVGAEMDLVLGNFKANHEGKPSIQPCVSLELTANSAKALMATMKDSSWTPAKLGSGVRMIAAAEEETMEDASVRASSVMAEFSDVQEADFDDEEPVVAADNDASETAAKAGQATVSGLGSTLKAALAAESAGPVASGTAGPVASAPALVADALWGSKESMAASMLEQKNRVGSEVFNGCLATLGIKQIDDLDHQSDTVVAMYAAVKKLADAPKAGKAKTNLF